MDIIFGNNELVASLPIIVTLVLAILCMLIGLLRTRWLAFGVAAIGLLYVFWLLWDLFGSNISAWNGLIQVDNMGLGFAMLVVLASIITIMQSRAFVERVNLESGAYFALILFSLAGMLLLCFARGTALIFVAIEVMSIPIYLLSAFHSGNGRSLEAGLKYLILGAFSTAFLLFGFAFLYLISGSPLFSESITQLQATGYQSLLVIAVGFILIGLLFKIGAVPFHGWVPDVYTGSPLTISGFMSVAVKTASFAVIVRILAELLPQSQSYWVPILWVAAMLSMIMGNFAALYQSNLKRLLAYSGIAHTGYILVGLLPLARLNENFTLDLMMNSGVLYYLLVYTLANIGAFGILAYVKKDCEDLETIEDFRGYAYHKPTIAIALAVCMVSLAGLPPLGGFVGKLLVFTGAVKGGFVGLVVIGVLTSLVAVYYYLRPVVVMFLHKADTEPVYQSQWYPDWALSLVTIVIVVGLLLFGVYPGAILGAF